MSADHIRRLVVAAWEEHGGYSVLSMLFGVAVVLTPPASPRLTIIRALIGVVVSIGWWGNLDLGNGQRVGSRERIALAVVLLSGAGFLIAAGVGFWRLVGN